MDKYKRISKQLYDLKAELEALGCRVEITITPHISGSAARKLSAAQRNLLELLWRKGELPFEKESNTLKSLIKRGLVESRWKPPQPGNDYGGTMRYKLTEAGYLVVTE